MTFTHAFCHTISVESIHDSTTRQNRCRRKWISVLRYLVDCPQMSVCVDRGLLLCVTRDSRVREANEMQMTWMKHMHLRFENYRQVRIVIGMQSKGAGCRHTKIRWFWLELSVRSLDHNSWWTSNVLPWHQRWINPLQHSLLQIPRHIRTAMGACLVVRGTSSVSIHSFQPNVEHAIRLSMRMQSIVVRPFSKDELGIILNKRIQISQKQNTNSEKKTDETRRPSEKWLWMLRIAMAGVTEQMRQMPMHRRRSARPRKNKNKMYDGRLPSLIHLSILHHPPISLDAIATAAIDAVHLLMFLLLLFLRPLRSIIPSRTSVCMWMLRACLCMCVCWCVDSCWCVLCVRVPNRRKTFSAATKVMYNWIERT